MSPSYAGIALLGEARKSREMTSSSHSCEQVHFGTGARCLEDARVLANGVIDKHKGPQ